MYRAGQDTTLAVALIATTLPGSATARGDGETSQAGGVVRAVAGADAASVLVEGPVEAALLRGGRAALTLRLHVSLTPGQGRS